MADPSMPGTAPASLHVYLSDRMQALYAKRGMWADGAPRGLLAGMLGARIPYLCHRWREAFYVTPQQIAALYRDILDLPDGAIGYHQRAQFSRRLREAATRGGLTLSGVLGFEHGGSPIQAAAPGAKPEASAPFTWLKRPEHGKAKALFEDHVMKTLRDFVDFTQSSAYGDGADSLGRVEPGSTREGA